MNSFERMCSGRWRWRLLWQDAEENSLDRENAVNRELSCDSTRILENKDSQGFSLSHRQLLSRPSCIPCWGRRRIARFGYCIALHPQKISVSALVLTNIKAQNISCDNSRIRSLGRERESDWVPDRKKEGINSILWKWKVLVWCYLNCWC